MPRKTKEAEATVPESEFTTATVYAESGGIHRVYSRADHGDAFAELANEFSAHTPGSRVEVH